MTWREFSPGGFDVRASCIGPVRLPSQPGVGLFFGLLKGTLKKPSSNSHVCRRLLDA